MTGNRRSRIAMVLGACLAGIGGLSIYGVAGARPADPASSATVGSSCADPEVWSVGAGPTLPRLAATLPGHINVGGAFPPGAPATVYWFLSPGYVICSAKVQLAGGATVAPTTVLPYPSPTPLGGQYDESSDPASHYTAITITAAKSPVPPGRSCNYPVKSTLFETFAARHGGRPPAVYVKAIEVSPTSLRLKLTPRKPNLRLCPKADLDLWLTTPHGELIRPIHVSVPINPHGGLTAPITLPPGSYRSGETGEPVFNFVSVYARYTQPPATVGLKHTAQAATAAQPLKPAPKTVFQCQKKFKGSKQRKARSACIQRVKSEKPGTSCAHPLISGWQGAAHVGDARDFTVEIQGVDPNLPNGSIEHMYLEITVHNPRVVLCPKAEIIVDYKTTEELLHSVPGVGRELTYFVSVEPHGGTSSTVLTQTGGYQAYAKARYVK